MAVINREKPIVLTGKSAEVFLKNKKSNEEKVRKHREDFNRKNSQSEKPDRDVSAKD